MGSFVGHAIPGSFFLLAGSWWVIRIYVAYFNSLCRRGEPYLSYVTFSPRIQRLPRLNLEALLITIAAGLGIFVEIIAACYLRHMEVAVSNQQHATMYLFFGLTGLVVLFMPVVTFIPCRAPAAYTCMALAFGVEALLFRFHLRGRDELDTVAHTLLLYSVYANTGSVLVEAVWRKSALPALLRASCTILQGTWFWQIGFTLYNPIGPSWELPEDGAGHHMLMKLVLIYTWHLAVVLIAVLMTGVAVGAWYRSKGFLPQQRMERCKLKMTEDGRGLLENDADDDDDDDDDEEDKDIV